MDLPHQSRLKENPRPLISGEAEISTQQHSFHTSPKKPKSQRKCIRVRKNKTSVKTPLSYFHTFIQFFSRVIPLFLRVYYKPMFFIHSRISIHSSVKSKTYRSFIQNISDRNTSGNIHFLLFSMKFTMCCTVKDECTKIFFIWIHRRSTSAFLKKLDRTSYCLNEVF